MSTGTEQMADLLQSTVTSGPGLFLQVSVKKNPNLIKTDKMSLLLSIVKIIHSYFCYRWKLSFLDLKELSF